MKRLLLVSTVLTCVVFYSTATSERPVALLVQVSDLHLSRNSAKQFAHCGDRDGDLKLLADTLLTSLQPTALLFTGDLVDSKDSRGKSVQFEDEWKLYQEVTQHIISSGIAEPSLLDIRGNHDVFDMPVRTGKQDYFPRYSVEGRRDPSSRVYLTAIAAPTATETGGRAQVVRNFSTPGFAACPLALLLGVDTTQEPGFRGPTNFVGMATEQLLQQLDDTIMTAKAALPEDCHVPILSYGHHPLSTIAHPRSSSRSTGRQLDEVLAAHGVCMYINGHLHGAFGQKAHRMRPINAGGYLAELETAAWKDDRRIRLIVLDNETFSFADLFFHTKSRFPAEFKDGTRQYTLHGLDASRTTGSVLLLMTQPPDARYSRLGAAGKLPRTFRTVRGMVIPLTRPSLDRCRVELSWLCTSSRHMGTIPMAPVAQGVPHLYSATLPERPCGAAPESQLLSLQMTTTCDESDTSPFDRSTSEARLVATQTGIDGKMVLTEAAIPPPINQTFLEWFVMAWDWPKFGELVFWCLWIVHCLFMLIVPRALAKAQTNSSGPSGTLGVGHSATGKSDPPAIWSPVSSFTDLLALAKATTSPTSTPAKVSRVDLRDSDMVGPVRVASDTMQGKHRHVLMSWLAWPLRVFKDMSSYKVAWMAILGYSVYLLLGPWFLARLLSDAPPALFFAYGMTLKREPEGSWEYERSPDTFLVTNIHMSLVVLPMTLWTASVLSSWRNRRPNSSAAAVGIVLLRLPLSWGEAIWGLFLFGLHALLVHHLSVLYGPLCAIASPGFGWTSLFFAVLLYSNLDASHANSQKKH